MLLGHKKDKIIPFAVNIDRPRDCHAEWSKSDRERQMSYNIAYNWNLKKRVQMNLFIKQRQSHRCKWTYGYQGGKVGDRLGGWVWHIHTTVYKTVH